MLQHGWNSRMLYKGEISQSQKGKHCVIPFLGGSSTSHTHDDGEEKGGCQWLREQRMELFNTV